MNKLQKIIQYVKTSSLRKRRSQKKNTFLRLNLNNLAFAKKCNFDRPAQGIGHYYRSKNC